VSASGLARPLADTIDVAVGSMLVSLSGLFLVAKSCQHRNIQTRSAKECPSMDASFQIRTNHRKAPPRAPKQFSTYWRFVRFQTTHANC